MSSLLLGRTQSPSEVLTLIYNQYDEHEVACFYLELRLVYFSTIVRCPRCYVNVNKREHTRTHPHIHPHTHVFTNFPSRRTKATPSEMLRLQ